MARIADLGLFCGNDNGRRNNHGNDCLSTASCGAAIGLRRGKNGTADFNIRKQSWLALEAAEITSSFFFLSLELLFDYDDGDARNGARRQCPRFQGLPARIYS